MAVLLGHLVVVSFNCRRWFRMARYRLLYESRGDDIFIATYPKSGTTWVQMILYQLTSSGEMDFPHICLKSPHLEEEFMNLGGDFERLAPPRVFKTHLSYDKVLKGNGKYLYVVRNGMSVAVSFYHHYLSYKRFSGSFSEFFEMFMRGEVNYGSWFDHVAGWLANRDGLDVLVVRYEDLHRDLEASVRRIAEFCNLSVDEDELPRIVERCSFSFMKQHEEKFDMARVRLCARGIELGKHLREGKSGSWKAYFSEEQRRAYIEELDRCLGGLGVDALSIPRATGAEPGTEEGVRGPGVRKAVKGTARVKGAGVRPSVPERHRGGDLDRRANRPGVRGRVARSLALPAVGASLRFFSSSIFQLAHLEHRLMLYQSRLRYVPRLDDVFIASYPRSGTVWVQMIVYQLMTDGAMGFAHIGLEQPHWEHTLLKPPGMDALERPRIVKTHLRYEEVLKGSGRYIYVLRNGADVAVSYYHRLRAYSKLRGGFDTFFPRFLRGGLEYGSWFEHVRGWLANREGLNVLFVTYEELQADLEASVRRIARFCDVELSDERLQRTLARCSFSFMKQHEEKLEPALANLASQKVVFNNFVRQGRTDSWKERFSEREKDIYGAEFDRRLGGLSLDLYRPRTASEEE